MSSNRQSRLAQAKVDYRLSQSDAERWARVVLDAYVDCFEVDQLGMLVHLREGVAAKATRSWSLLDAEQWAHLSGIQSALGESVVEFGEYFVELGEDSIAGCIAPRLVKVAWAYRFPAGISFSSLTLDSDGSIADMEGGIDDFQSAFGLGNGCYMLSGSTRRWAVIFNEDDPEELTWVLAYDATLLGELFESEVAWIAGLPSGVRP